MARYTPEAGGFGQIRALTSPTSTYVNPLVDNQAGMAETQISEGLMTLAQGTGRARLQEKRAEEQQAQEMLSAMRPMYETFASQGMSHDKIVKSIVASTPKSLQARAKKALGEGQDLETVFGPVSSFKINESVGRQNAAKASTEILEVLTPIASSYFLEKGLDGTTSVGDSMNELLNSPEIQEIMETYSGDLNPLQQLYFSSTLKSAIAKEVPGWVESSRKSGYAVIQGEVSQGIEDDVKGSWKQAPEVTLESAHSTSGRLTELSQNLPKEEGDKAVISELDTLEARLDNAVDMGKMTPSQREMYLETIYEDLDKNPYFKNNAEIMRKALDVKMLANKGAEEQDEEVTFSKMKAASRSNPLMRWARRASAGESELDRFAAIESLADKIYEAPDALTQEELDLVEMSGLSLDDDASWDALSVVARDAATVGIQSDISSLEKTERYDRVQAESRVNAARRRIRDGQSTVQQELNLLSADGMSYDKLQASFSEDWAANDSSLQSILDKSRTYFISQEDAPYFYSKNSGWFVNEGNGGSQEALNSWLLEMDELLSSGQRVDRDQIISLLGRLDPELPEVQSLDRRIQAEEARIEQERVAADTALTLVRNIRTQRVEQPTPSPETPTERSYGENQSFGQLFETVSTSPRPSDFSLTERMKQREQLMISSGGTLSAREIDILIAILFDQGK